MSRLPRSVQGVHRRETRHRSCWSSGAASVMPETGQTATCLAGDQMSGRPAEPDPRSPNWFIAYVPEPDAQKSTGASPADHPSAGRMT
jgi:hypothetical protein